MKSLQLSFIRSKDRLTRGLFYRTPVSEHLVGTSFFNLMKKKYFCLTKNKMTANRLFIREQVIFLFKAPAVHTPIS